MGKDRGASAESHLPLKPAVLEILISLGAGDRHGYALLTELTERTRGRIELFPAQLYRHLRQMASDRLIEEVEGPPDPGDDERRRYYRLTPEGRDVARAELRRLEEVLQSARATFPAARRTS